VFWDVGAHIGSVTLVAAARCRQVVSFEPDPRSLSGLADNLRHNGLANVEVIPSALGTSSGQATLYQSAGTNTGMTSLLADGLRPTTGLHVNVTRADDLISRRPELAPTIMKIDVEGAEHLVLGGATRLLQMGSLRAIVFEDRRDAENRPTNAEAVLQLERARYRIEPFALSEATAADDMFNFLATRSTAA
jgi:FkbM family methyltransferase